MVGARPGIWRLIALVPGLLIGCTALAGCSTRTGARPPAAETPVTTSARPGAVEYQVTPAVQQLIEQAINAVNATGGGPVPVQRAELARLASAGQVALQNRCPVAASTIAFDPVYARLARAPGWRPGSGTLPGTVFALPTLIRIYTGDRITGTDLTDLHVAIDAGRVRLPAICPT